jgi:NTE family protein
MARRLTGLALAGGGPLGAIWEIGALVALDEALVGLDFAECDVLVGVSSGAFIAAGLANGISPRAMYDMFIGDGEADDPFEPSLLMQPAFGEYLMRLATLPDAVVEGLDEWLGMPSVRQVGAGIEKLGRTLPTGIFDSGRMGEYLARLLTLPGRSDDFRTLRRKLFLVATKLDTCEAVAFGSPGWEDVPISRAVQASSALPGLFPPINIHGCDFVDGALMKTLHASVALEENVELLFCINPLVPFDASLAGRRRNGKPFSIAEQGLPAVLSQSFRAMIHSRMEVAMQRYGIVYPNADIVLLEPERGDPDMFFTNVFSYAERRRLSEHAYQKTRADLRRRHAELRPVLARAGLKLDEAVLADPSARLSHSRQSRRGSRAARTGQTSGELDRTLEELESVIHRTRSRHGVRTGANRSGARGKPH